MSGVLGELSNIITSATQAGQALSVLTPIPASGNRTIFLTKRRIGTIIPDVSIEEQQTERVQVTQHPVAIGSPISDHAYRMPRAITMRVGWAEAPRYGQSTLGLSRVRNIYDQLVKLQGQLQPITITTGKGTYYNMMLTELSVRTDRSTENALVCEAHFQEVLRVSSKSTTQPAMQSQTLPQTTQGTQDGTERQPRPSIIVNEGILPPVKD